MFLAAVFNYLSCFSQLKGEFEQYHYVGACQPYTWIPIVHLQNNRHWHAEARYNYEEENTFSLYLGKTFSCDRHISSSFTPLLGWVAGKFNGPSAGLNVDLEVEKFFFSAQSQYSFSFSHPHDAFLYNWSEAGYQPMSWLYTGISSQLTCTTKGAKLETGFLAGVSNDRFTLPVYAFNFFTRERYFIIGLIMNWGGYGKQTPPISFP